MKLKVQQTWSALTLERVAIGSIKFLILLMLVLVLSACAQFNTQKESANAILFKAKESVSNASRLAHSQLAQNPTDGDNSSAMPWAYINRAEHLLAAANSAQSENNRPLSRKFAKLALSEVRVAEAALDTLKRQNERN